MLTKIKANWKGEAVRHFMTELIDYAGLFPSASLPLSKAISSYQSYIKGSNGWMLRTFVISVTRLKELEPFEACFNETGRVENITINPYNSQCLCCFMRNLQF